MGIYNKIYWLLDLRFDFLIPSFLKEYKIERNELLMVNSYHGSEREKKGYGKIIRLRSNKWNGKIGVVQEEPSDLNHLFVVHENLLNILNNGERVFVVALTGVGLPTHKNLFSLTSTGDIAEKTNNKKWQLDFFKKNKIQCPRTLYYRNSEEMLKSTLLRKRSRKIVKPLCLSGGYQMRIVSSQDELKKIVENGIGEGFNDGFLLSDYIEHSCSYATMGIISSNKEHDGEVHVFETIDEQIFYDEIYYGGLRYPTNIEYGLKENMLEMTEKAGKGLSQHGYRGFYNLDFVVSEEGIPYAVEINARITFGTILIALVYGEDKLWGMLRGDGLERRISEKELKQALVLGKLKIEPGSVYGGQRRFSDIHEWWCKNDNNDYYESCYINHGESFLYGSYVGMFARRLNEKRERDGVNRIASMDIQTDYPPKKTLLGLYIDNYKGFSKTNICFSATNLQKGWIAFNQEKNQFNFSWKNYDNPMDEGFFNNWSSGINTLVGEGGSGKTTILWLICHWMGCFAKNEYPYETGAIILQVGEKKGVCVFSKGESCKLEGADSICQLEKQDVKEFTHNLQLIYYTNTISGIKFENSTVLTDISVSKRIRDAFIRSGSGDDPIDTYMEGRREAINRIILKKRYQDGERVLKIKINNYYDTIDNRVKNEIDYEMNRITETIDGFSVPGIVSKLVRSLVGFFYSRISESQRRDFANSNRAFLYRTIGITSLEELRDSVNEFIKDCVDFIKYDKEEKKLFVALVNWLFNHCKDDKVEGWGRDDIETDKQRYVFKYCINNRDILNDEEFIEIYNQYNCPNEKYFLTMKWDLEYLGSSEQNSLGLFADLLPKENYKLLPGNYWILLDEPDNALSPEIARRFVNDYLEFCEKFYVGSYIQTWLTTNSPIVLSDIPSQYVHYLRSKNHKKVVEVNRERTFIANTYDLLAEGYFLEKAVGEFAENKVYKLACEIMKIEKNVGNASQSIVSQESILYKLENIEKQVELISEYGTRMSLKKGIKRCRNLLKGYYD